MSVIFTCQIDLSWFKYFLHPFAADAILILSNEKNQSEALKKISMYSQIIFKVYKSNNGFSQNIQKGDNAEMRQYTSDLVQSSYAKVYSFPNRQ